MCLSNNHKHLEQRLSRGAMVLLQNTVRGTRFKMTTSKKKDASGVSNQVVLALPG